MGCRYACVCSRSCPGCSDYEPEKYVGEAEDVYNETHEYDYDYYSEYDYYNNNY